jgi:RNA polymerase sigma factor (sigma-70 family)
MATVASHPILQLLRRVTGDERVKDLSDANLLESFHATRDEGAFDALLRRHGPMVLDVCRCVSGNEADAEDAFQATFLILAHKARSIRKSASLGNWLYGVAYRTARKAQTTGARRRKHEARVPPRVAAEVDDLSWNEVRRVLHEELSRLAESYRAPLVLCYLQGRTQDRAAAILGMSESNLKKRLERGRSMLRARLVRRGLGLSAGLLAASDPAATSATELGGRLLEVTVAAASSVAIGQSGAVAASVAALTKGGLRAMFVSQLKAAGAVVVALGMLASLTGFMANEALTAAAQTAAAQTPVAAVPERSKPNAKDAALADAEAIQGTWTVVELHQVNQKPTKQERDWLAKGHFKIRFTKDTMTMLVDGSSSRYRLDATRKPKQMEILDGDNLVARSIYEMSGDRLRICQGRKPEPGEAPEAPTDFDIDKARPGTFPTLFVMVRDVPKGKGGANPPQEALAPKSDGARRHLLQEGVLTRAKGPLEQIFRFALDGSRLRLDRSGWSERPTAPKAAIKDNAVVIDASTPTIEGHVHQIVEIADGGGGHTHMSNRSREMRFDGKALSGRLVTRGDVVRLDLEEITAPHRSLQFQDDGAGSMSLLVSGPGDHLLVTQSDNGTFTVSAAIGGKTFVAQAPSFLAMYQQHKATLDGQILPVLNGLSIRLFVPPSTQELRAAVRAMLLRSPAVLEETRKLLANLDDANFTVRDKATSLLNDRFELYQDLIKAKLKDRGLTVEARRRLENIVSAHPNAQKIGQVIAALDLLNDPAFLVELLEDSAAAERPAVAARLERITGQRHGSDVGTWKRWLAQREQPAAR